MLLNVLSELKTLSELKQYKTGNLSYTKYVMKDYYVAFAFVLTF